MKAPLPFRAAPKPWLFLAGSIEMDRAELWQPKVVEALSDLHGTILNPRRDDWDASWRQSIEDAQFRTQVEWELEAQENADLIAMYFSPGTQSPITLLELGLFARGGRLIVCCPDGFWRKGNIDIVCARYGIERATSIDDLLAGTRFKFSRAR